MHTEQMVTLKPHRYGGVDLQVDQQFLAHKRDVKLLKALGRAQRAEPSQDAEEVQAAPAARRTKQPTKRTPARGRRYNRRDMRAKD